ncbi:MAG: RNA-binding S4 domain-containing protein [Desulfuromonadaceae bacterium]|nr:RNA-binding S4 domain-containing protein [Desulfuromonadaceae bacterium]
MTELEFDLEQSPHIELYQLLKATGLCGSGGMAKHVIAAGEVTVDDTVETRKRGKIRLGQRVTFESTSIVITKN